MPNRKYFFLGLFLVCMSTLMLQIIQTRILSVVSMYYLAFLSISMAMLGMTAGALIVYFKLDKVTPENISIYLSRITTAYALAIFVCFLLQLASPMPVVKLGTLVVMWLKMIFLLAAPFAVAGVVVSLALTRSPFPVGITYGVDLLGAAVGCLAVLLLLNWIDAPSAILFVAALSAVGAICFRLAHGNLPADETFPNWRILKRPAVVALALAAIASANASTRYGLQPIAIKMKQTGVQVGTNFDYERWNSFSRILVGPSTTEEPFLWGASPKMPQGLKVEERILNIDGFAGTAMPRFTRDAGSFDFLKYDITNLAYLARSNSRVAIIGVGSGRDLLSAYTLGSKDITGVELNPIFIDLLTDDRKLRNYAGIADLPGVRLVVDEGRSWFARTKEKFDLVQMSMIDTFAATGAGAFSLSENGLYTIEGWRIFLSALNPSGIFTVSRWHSPTAPIEIGRTTSLAVAALLSLGIEKPRNHIFLASYGSLATIIVSRQPLSDADLRSLTDTCDKLGFNVMAAPDKTPTEAIFADLLSASSLEDLSARTSRYSLDVSAPTDARPFFFNQLDITNLRNVGVILDEYRRTGTFISGTGLVAAGNLAAMGTLLLLIVLSALAVIFAIILPARSSIRNVSPRLAWLGSVYFLLIGLGFMLIEIGMIQRVSVFMGHPIYALGIVLFSIILSTGLGSLLSERIPLKQPSHVVAWLSLLAVYVFAMPHWLPELAAFESEGLVTRSLVCIAAILPAGLLMGFGFPTGMRLVMMHDPRPTPWFWGVNGAAGVFAAGIAVACSIAFSIDVTLRLGALSYLLLMPTALMLMTETRTAVLRAA